MKCYARDDSKPWEERKPCQLDANHKGHHDHGGHRWSLRVNGSRHCYDCDATDYDRHWGSGIFRDWPASGMEDHG
jgi:hypothetical protein